MSAEKSRKAFIPFPFNGSDTVSALSHLVLGWKRKVQKLNSDFYVERYLGQDLKGLALESIPNRVCHICGFSLISLKASNGWIMEACSAHDIEKAIRGGGLSKFLNDLGSQYSYNLSDEHSKV